MAGQSNSIREGDKLMEILLYILAALVIISGVLAAFWLTKFTLDIGSNGND